MRFFKHFKFNYFLVHHSLTGKIGSQHRVLYSTSSSCFPPNGPKSAYRLKGSVFHFYFFRPLSFPSPLKAANGSQHFNCSLSSDTMFTINFSNISSGCAKAISRYGFRCHAEGALTYWLTLRSHANRGKVGTKFTVYIFCNTSYPPNSSARWYWSI